MLDLFRLDGKTALVTGAKRGIGFGIAKALAEAGADIIGVSATLEEQGSAIEKAVRDAGRNFAAYRCDFSNRSAVRAFAQKVVSDNPTIDILVNNAGTIRRKPAAEHDDTLWDEVLETNLSASFVLTREIGRGMIERGGGKVVFTASLLTFQGGITVPGYAASKGAIGQLTKAFANEWAVSGVNVNAIAPGYIETDNTEALRNDPVRYRAILDRIPAGRWGRPEDFAGAAVYLASSASDYVHGEILVVDGGWMGR
ncbi:SDR family oxidoreductase [Notoacmeibacter marinus]|uniref:SDR family oxidoreductase n=1 Tax=Notoacmeibacter marinus TaxID=1876515 RepID=UPI001966C921|nr:SDR family oxidoreductase [Notoacmeibacter marinus]